MPVSTCPHTAPEDSTYLLTKIGCKGLQIRIIAVHCMCCVLDFESIFDGRYNSDLLANKARTVYTELSGMGSIILKKICVGSQQLV